MAAAAAPVAGGGGWRKGASRSWLVVSPTGTSHVEEAGKHSVMQRTGLPARDLRLLDPMLSHPSTILGREKAIVINLEHIRAVVTAIEVIVPNSKDPVVVPFLQDLRDRIVNVVDNENGVKLLPFEFRALEVCLESACRSLEFETKTLEDEAYPALDELTSKISTLNLERVRQIKSRLVAIYGRVQKVRDELEHLLDDDMDMAAMYLTQKMLASQSVAEPPSRADLDNDPPDAAAGDEWDESGSENITVDGFKPKIEELEMLLEAYFVQIDGTLNNLSALREYVDDTEDYINIMLDDKQNQLLQMGVLLSTATLVCSAGIVIVSVFGMNIEINLYTIKDTMLFWKIAFSVIAGCVLLYIIAIGWGKKSGLLQ